MAGEIYVIKSVRNNCKTSNVNYKSINGCIMEESATSLKYKFGYVGTNNQKIKLPYVCSTNVIVQIIIVVIIILGKLLLLCSCDS